MFFRQKKMDYAMRGGVIVLHHTRPKFQISLASVYLEAGCLKGYIETGIAVTISITYMI